VRSVR